MKRFFKAITTTKYDASAQFKKSPENFLILGGGKKPPASFRGFYAVAGGEDPLDVPQFYRIDETGTSWFIEFNSQIFCNDDGADFFSHCGRAPLSDMVDCVFKVVPHKDVPADIFRAALLINPEEGKKYSIITNEDGWVID